MTCLWYIREVDPQTLLLTGLTRDGVYLVENGEVTGAVNNFRFNESPVDLLRRFSHASGHGPELLARVGRLLPAHRDPGPARPRLQHVHRLPGQLTLTRQLCRGNAACRRRSDGSARVASGDRHGRVVGLAGVEERLALEVVRRPVLPAYDVQPLAVVVAARAEKVPAVLRHEAVRLGAPHRVARRPRTAPSQANDNAVLPPVPDARGSRAPRRGRPRSGSTAAGGCPRSPRGCRAGRRASPSHRRPTVAFANTTAAVRRQRVGEAAGQEARHRPGVPDQHARAPRAQRDAEAVRARERRRPGTPTGGCTSRRRGRLHHVARRPSRGTRRSAQVLDRAPQLTGRRHRAGVVRGLGGQRAGVVVHAEAGGVRRLREVRRAVHAERLAGSAREPRRTTGRRGAGRRPRRAAP